MVVSLARQYPKQLWGSWVSGTSFHVCTSSFLTYFQPCTLEQVHCFCGPVTAPEMLHYHGYCVCVCVCVYVCVSPATRGRLWSELG